MTRVHYFPRYSQKENFATNNTLLLFYRIYDSNRYNFEQFLTILLQTGDAEAGLTPELGLQIAQQIGTDATVLDGFLYQASMYIAIETKIDANSFRYDQLVGHLTKFKDKSSGWLLLLSPDVPKVSGAEWEDLMAQAIQAEVTLILLTFQDIIDAFRKCLMSHNEELQALVDDYEDFCSSEGLLPKDKWTIFVPPCGQSFDINKKQKLYFCPTAWARRRGRFLGIYNLKAVRLIGEVSKIVDYDVTHGKPAQGYKVSEAEEGRIRNAASDFGLKGLYQFYLCDEMVETHFAKISSGGIMGHRYIDLRTYLTKFEYADLHQLAFDLRSVSWL